MKLQWAAVLGVLLVGSGVWAQEPRPSVVPFPLEFKRSPSMQEKDVADLQTTWRRLVRVVADVPDTGTVDAALNETARRDCEKEDECLKALALKAKTLYAVYANVGLDLTRTKVVATGRVVRDDGKLMGEQGKEIRTATVELGIDSFPHAVKASLARLVEQLGIAGLSPVRGVELPKMTVDVPRKEEVTPKKKVEEPATKKDAEPSPISAKRVISIASIGVGVVALGIGLGLSIGAESDTSKLKLDENGLVTGLPATPENAVLAKGLPGRRAAGGILLGAGAAVAATGVVLFLMARSEEEQALAVGAAPVPGGFAVSVGGKW